MRVEMSRDVVDESEIRPESDETCWKLVVVTGSEEFSSSHLMPRLLILVVVIQVPLTHTDGAVQIFSINKVWSTNAKKGWGWCGF